MAIKFIDPARREPIDTMPFYSTDVARMAGQIAKKPVWLTKALFGLNPRGIAFLLRKLWLAGEATTGELTTVKAAFEIASREARESQWRLEALRAETKTVTFRLDKALAAFPKRTAGVIIMGEGDFSRFAEDEYDCTAKEPRASSGERWAYTYKGYPVWTGKGFGGPFILSKPAFEGFRLALGGTLALRER